ncbi:hypothetical protein AVEN_95272-1 [Araneus ventricosus]|uniref:Uncharacterized protein n=1 Tax=Araneus ventricosus TaxID=182803 RepID=A0A4Y2DG40_ARAVE|nr:hypothetical protein AVEN_95272-1 [Araneus ventricosus]
MIIDVTRNHVMSNPKKKKLCSLRFSTTKVRCTMNLYQLDKLLTVRSSFERTEGGNPKKTSRQMARRMVTALRQFSLPHIDCCEDMARRKEHSTPPPTSLLTGFSTIGFLALPQDQNGPER